MVELSSQTISLIFKSRMNLLKQLSYQGYNTTDYEVLNVNELNAMYINNQLDMTLTTNDNKKTHVIYHIEKALRKDNIDDYIERDFKEMNIRVIHGLAL